MAREVLPYVFSLIGGRNWKSGPGDKASPLMVEVWTLLRDEEAEPYAPTPYFWSDQHGVKLQFVGRASAGDETVVLEGSFEEDRVLIAYGRAGLLVGALGIRRPARVMALQRMIGAGGPFPPEG